MRYLLFSMLLTAWAGTGTWLTNFDDAKIEARQTNHLILLNFSGSDWCAPCVRMKREIFESQAFTTYAGDNLVLLNADFPRSKKNKLSDKQTKQNEKLAEKYNPEGQFPLTVLLDSTGRVLHTWTGLPIGGAEKFVKDLSASHD